MLMSSVKRVARTVTPPSASRLTTAGATGAAGPSITPGMTGTILRDTRSGSIELDGLTGSVAGRGVRERANPSYPNARAKTGTNSATSRSCRVKNSSRRPSTVSAPNVVPAPRSVTLAVIRNPSPRR